MNALPCFLFIFAFLVFAVSNSYAIAVFSPDQEIATASEPKCDEAPASGKPVLKRRAPTSEDATNAEATLRVAEQARCKPKDRADAVNAEKPVQIEFKGLHAFDEAELLRRLREERIPVSGGRMPDSEVLNRAVQSLKGCYQARGYMAAMVDVLSYESSKSVTFMINEGARFPIAAIRFEGGQTFSSQELAAKASEFLAQYKDSRSGYDAALLDYSLRNVTNFVRSQGYLQAKQGPPKTELAGDGLMITVPFEEGPLYRLGKVRIEGSQYLSPQQIRALLRLQPGDVANGEAIGKWLFEDLKKVYGEAGYVAFTAEPEPEFKTASGGGHEGVVDLEVTVEEGKQYKLRSIRFLGADGLATELQDLLLIHEGDVYNHRLFEQSVVRLNKTGLFEDIDKDKDTDFMTDDEEGLLDIVIKVRRVAP